MHLRLLRRWLPEHGTWAEDRFSVNVDAKTPIGEKRTLRAAATGSNSTSPLVKVDFSTHCVAVEQKSKEWLDVRFPDGVTRRLRYAGTLRPQPLTLNKTQVGRTPATRDIRDTARCASRMLGAAKSRYVNVGFRCVKRLWTMPESEQAPSSDASPADSGPR